MKRQGRAWRGLVLVIALMLVIPVGVAQAGKGPGGGGGGGETTGSNLSFPVIWSDGPTKVLRGVYGAPVFLGSSVTDADGTWYLQRDPNNSWQAQSADWSASDVFVDWVDWGDNLESKDWRLGSKVRVETVLFQDLATPMKGFTMKYLSGQGPSEMWGTNTNTYDSAQATIYSHGARLTIQKIDPAAAAGLTWSADSHQWVGTGAIAPVFNQAVRDAADGSGYYNSEVNIQGKMIYGYNWDTARVSSGAGTYRLTFSLDTGYTGLNTFFFYNSEEDRTKIVPSTEGEALVAAEPTGNTAYVVPDYNLTYIDVELTRGGGRTAP